MQEVGLGQQEDGINELDVAVWNKDVECELEDGLRVFEAVDYGTAVNVIELLAKRPVVFSTSVMNGRLRVKLIS
jgi:hypothetical protein